MLDKSVEYHDLRMYCADTNVAGFPLPEGYGYRYFTPGDERHWARIERSAGEFDGEEDALAAFERHFGAHRDQLPGRMIFLLDGDAPVGTATAWFTESMGRLHWVAIDAEHQGRGLSRPMVAHAMRRLYELGHRQATLSTQTPSWVGIRVYLSLGWAPLNDGAADFVAGWRIVHGKTPCAATRAVIGERGSEA